jgi:cell division protein FtsW
MAAGKSLFAKEDRRWDSGEKADPVFWVILLLVLLVGLTMLYSASYAQSLYDTGYRTSAFYLGKQAVCALIGLAAMWVISQIPAKLWLKLAWPLYWASIVLLLLVSTRLHLIS